MRVIALAVALVVAAAGCGGSPPASGTGPTATGGNGSPRGFSETYDVTYRDGIVVLDEGYVRENVLESDDPELVRFRRPPAEAGDLVPDAIVIVPDVAVGRVAATEQAGDSWVLALEPVNLDEVVASGRIGWRYDIDWMDVVDDRTASMPTGAITAADIPGVEFSGEVSGWEVTYTLKPAPDRLNMELVAKRSNVAVSGKGWINNFTQETLLQYEDSQGGTKMEAKTIGLEGDFEITWAAFKAGDPSLDTEIVSFQVPVELPIPFSVGPLPMELRLKANVRVVPEFSFDGASSGGSYRIHYRSDQGFSVDNTLQSPFGDVHQADLALGSTETVTAGFGPVGFGVGIEFPRLELAALGSTAVAFITVNTYSAGLWTPGTTLSSEIPPCQMARTTVTSIAGYKLSLLGFEDIADQKELWKREHEDYLNDEPCTLTGS